MSDDEMSILPVREEEIFHSLRSRRGIDIEVIGWRKKVHFVPLGIVNEGFLGDCVSVNYSGERRTRPAILSTNQPFENRRTRFYLALTLLE